MNRERFKNMLEAAKQIPVHKFAMERWCGCIIGNTTEVTGLTLVFDELSGTQTPSWHGAEGYGALCDYFGISLKDAIRLFSNASYPRFCNLSVVLERLERYYEEEGKHDRDSGAYQRV